MGLNDQKEKNYDIVSSFYSHVILENMSQEKYLDAMDIEDIYHLQGGGKKKENQKERHKEEYEEEEVKENKDNNDNSRSSKLKPLID